MVYFENENERHLKLFRCNVDRGPSGEGKIVIKSRHFFSTRG